MRLLDKNDPNWRIYRNWVDLRRAETQIRRRYNYVQFYLDTQGPALYFRQPKEVPHA